MARPRGGPGDLTSTSLLEEQKGVKGQVPVGRARGVGGGQQLGPAGGARGHSAGRGLS